MNEADDGILEQPTGLSSLTSMRGGKEKRASVGGSFGRGDEGIRLFDVGEGERRRGRDCVESQGDEPRDTKTKSPLVDRGQAMSFFGVQLAGGGRKSRKPLFPMARPMARRAASGARLHD